MIVKISLIPVHTDDLLSMAAVFQEVFVDPVIAADGFTYERSAIEDWLSRKMTSPMTNEKLAHSMLIPNISFRGFIQDMRESGNLPI